MPKSEANSLAASKHWPSAPADTAPDMPAASNSDAVLLWIMR